MSAYLHHLTLTTGHSRRSPRSEVADDVVATARGLLHEALAADGQPVPLLPEALSHYALDARAAGAALLATLWAPAGPHVHGRPYAGRRVPLVLIGVAARSTVAPRLWRTLVDTPGLMLAPGLSPPPAPWVAAAILTAPAAYMPHMALAADLERIVGWAWIERRDAAPEDAP